MQVGRLACVCARVFGIMWGVFVLLWCVIVIGLLLGIDYIYAPVPVVVCVFFCRQVLELLRGLVKVSSSVSRNYSTSYLSEMRVVGGGGGFANYDDLSILSAQFHAAVRVFALSAANVVGIAELSTGLVSMPKSITHQRYCFVDPSPVVLGWVGPG